jgi:hypothetical protein
MLKLDLVQEQGYVNLRCASKPGCQPRDIKNNIHINEEIWGQIFGDNVTMPKEIGAACCAQFAVSRTQVQQRTKDEYIHFRNWVLDTLLPDRESGRVMEYLWHIIFGRDGVHCPDPDQCYCEVYGRC